jgi:hypothetical protein
MKTAFFTKRTHPESRTKVNNGGVEGLFCWRPNHASKCPERTHSNPIQPKIAAPHPNKPPYEYRALAKRPC